MGAEATKVTSVAGLLSQVPDLSAAEAVDVAKAVNFLSQGTDFDVIETPDAFAEAYRAKLATEDPSAPWQEGVVRLSDYGVPDFSEIAAPVLSDGTLVYFARDTFLGLPYRVSVDLTGDTVNVTDDDYACLTLQPVASSGAA